MNVTTIRDVSCGFDSDVERDPGTVSHPQGGADAGDGSASSVFADVRKPRAWNR